MNTTLIKPIKKYFIVSLIIIIVIGTAYGIGVPEAQAAIAFDATTNSGAKLVTSSASWSHTNTGSSLVLVVGVQMRDATAGDRVVSTITYNGVALTNAVVRDSGATAISSEIWFLVAPATGANTLAVTLVGIVDFWSAGAISVTGAGQSGQPDATNSATGNGTVATVDVTTVADNSWVFDSLYTKAGDAPVAGAGQTGRMALGPNGGADRSAMSHEGPQTPAGAVTMSWTWVQVGQDWVTTAASFKPALTVKGTKIKGKVKFRGKVKLR